MEKEGEEQEQNRHVGSERGEGRIEGGVGLKEDEGNAMFGSKA